MFQIGIKVLYGTLTGIDALDWRRERGLPDGTSLTCDPPVQWFGVDEAFARQWFPSYAKCMTAEVHMNDLEAGDVFFLDGFKINVDLTLSFERAKHFFIEWRTKQLRLQEEYQARRQTVDMVV